jgi:hypothetical protein
MLVTFVRSSVMTADVREQRAPSPPWSIEERDRLQDLLTEAHSLDREMLQVMLQLMLQVMRQAIAEVLAREEVSRPQAA